MDRRRFVALLAATAVPGAVQPLRGAPPLGLATITVQRGMQRDPAATLRAIADIGYREIGLSRLYGHEPQALREWIVAAGLGVDVGHVQWSELDDWSATLERSRTLGHRWLFVPSVPNAMWRSRSGIAELVARFHECGAEARRQGMTLGFHNHAVEFEPVDGFPAVGRFWDETDPDLVVIELDCYWVTRAGHDPVVWLRRYPGRTPALHLKDLALGGGMAPVGSGTIDWRRIFAERKRAGVRHLLVEHDDPADELASARTSWRYLAGRRW